MTFSQKLEVGKAGESLIGRYLQSLGHSVMPVYEKIIKEGKGPQLFHASGNLVLPDMLILGGTLHSVCFVEAKHKSVFSWHFKTGRWTTGIDQRHFRHYLEVETITGIPVWLYFFHRESQPWEGDMRHGCPPKCPTGLYGQRLTILRDAISHTAPPKNASQQGNNGHGNSGMVYWAEESLNYIATKAEILELPTPAQLERPA